MVAHESEHYLQKLTPSKYANGQEALKAGLAAYNVQRKIDPNFFLRTDHKVIEYIVKNPLYPQINKKTADGLLKSGIDYTTRLKQLW